MAPTTRAQSSKIPPKTPTRSPIKRHEYSTNRKYRFFLKHEESAGIASFASICADVEITTPCGRKWLKKRDELGDLAWHKTRKLSNKLGEPEHATKEEIQAIISPSRNPVRDQCLEAQINFLQINLKPRQVRNRLKKDTNGGGIYKAAFVGKELSQKNIEERIKYGKLWRPYTLSEHWWWIFFTDEAHIDPSSMAAPTVARELGKRYKPENIAQRPKKKGTKWHIAGWVNWWGKSERLIFYNDEEDYKEQPPMPPKPRHRPKTESPEEYKQRLKEWEALKPHKVDVKVGGNHMTQKYYTEILLPVYIDALHKARCYHDESAQWVFQEDGDPSHGIKKDGLARELKNANWITNIKHPAQSPDLNPMEGIWNIIKQRLRRRVLRTDEEWRAAIEEEWGKITLEEIRDRIRDMPRRCDLLVKTGGKPIKSKLW
jgi:hypothetical protein